MYKSPSLKKFNFFLKKNRVNDLTIMNHIKKQEFCDALKVKNSCTYLEEDYE